MSHASTNGYLTREQFLKLSTFDVELPGLGKVKCRKIGAAEYEALWPLPPEASTAWPKIEGDPLTEEGRKQLEATRQSRRDAETAWLRQQPQAQQLQWRATATEVTFRLIAACAKSPAFTVEDARALGDAADVLAAEILIKSGLYKEPSKDKESSPPPPAGAAEPAVEAVAGAA